jgi:hypothetical protein
MIKVTLGEVKTQKEKPFPKLMKSISTGRIVLMHEKCCGTVIFEQYAYYGLGHYSKSWAMMDFTDYNEPITIQNA